MIAEYMYTIIIAEYTYTIHDHIVNVQSMISYGEGVHVHNPGVSYGNNTCIELQNHMVT